MVVLLFMLLINQNSNCLAANSDSTQTPVKILFIGASYFKSNKLLDLFENLANCAEKQVDVHLQTAGGPYLSNHAQSIYTETKINSKNWDFIVLQGVGSLTAYPDTYTAHPLYPALVTLHDKIHLNCESTKMVFCLPWAFEDGMTWMGWPDNYEDMQIKIYENTLQYSDDVGCVIAPVGWAWYTVLKEKNYPLHYLHLSDWNHPSIRGSYLMACVIFSTLFQETCVDLDYYGGLLEEDASDYQEVASNAVLDSIELWNITASTIKGSGSSIPRQFKLHQNYPNPFNPDTRINYEITKAARVELTVFNVLGKTNVKLVDEYKIQGSYSVKFDATDYNSGLYFYRINIGAQFQTNKMLLIK